MRTVPAKATAGALFRPAPLLPRGHNRGCNGVPWCVALGYECRTIPASAMVPTMETKMADRSVNCPECGFQDDIHEDTSRPGVTARTAFGGDSGNIEARCKHKDEDNGGYRCRFLQAAIDSSRL